MPEYKLVVSGYGKSVAIGTIDKDLHFFWKSNNPHSVKAQLFLDAYSTDLSLRLDDPSDPLYLKMWKNHNNVLYVTGTYPDQTHLFVFDSSDNLLWASDQPDFLVDQEFHRDQDLSAEYYIQTWRERKGEFCTAMFQADVFQPELFSARAYMVDTQNIIYKFCYADQELPLIQSEFGGITLDYEFFRIK
jgi:hypothetical protein